VNQTAPQSEPEPTEPVFHRRGRGPAILAVLAAVLIVAACSVLTLGGLTLSLVGARAFDVPSASNIPTILPGDSVLVSTTLPVKRGDLVVLRNPAGGPASTLIKRIIAVAGDTVDIRDGRVILDGRALDEPYVQGATLPGSVATPVTVPKGSIYVLGDNRMNSEDSRWWGTVRADLVVGRVVAIYWPPSRVRRF
jgi:signal peptidase I